MIDLSAIASCTELTSEHARQAASSSTEMRLLLKRVAEIAKPDEGCPKVLMAFAHLVGQEWVEGDLRVELSGDDKSTAIATMSEHGVGIRERLLPTVRFAVSIDEFERALELAPRLVLPLRITDEDGKLVLTPLAVPEAQVTTVPPPELGLEDASLGDGERTTAPPPADELQVLDEAMPYADGLDGDATGKGAEITTAPPPPPSDGSEALAYPARMQSGPVPSGTPRPDGATDEPPPSVHTRPTVRRMVAIDAAAIAAVNGRRDPRREEE